MTSHKDIRELESLKEDLYFGLGWASNEGAMEWEEVEQKIAKLTVDLMIITEEIVDRRKQETIDNL